MINGNMIGIGSVPLKTVILTDENGNELTGVVTGSEVVFTATDNDVREGFVYASNEGISTGTKIIPAYHTTETAKAISVGKDLIISLPGLDRYDYTKLQVIICAFNSSLSKSVSAEMVVINDNGYNVGSTEAIAVVSKDDSAKSINLGLTNNGNAPLILRCFTYKEIE